MAKQEIREKAKELFLAGLGLPEIELELGGQVSGASLRRWAREGGWRPQLAHGKRQDTVMVLSDPATRKLLTEKGDFLIGEVVKRLNRILNVTEMIAYQENLCRGIMAECGAGLNELKLHRDLGGKAVDNLAELQRISSVVEKSVQTWRLVVGLATQRIELDLSHLHPEVLESFINGEEVDP
jgi:hypothetical protein